MDRSVVDLPGCYGPILVSQPEQPKWHVAVVDRRKGGHAVYLGT